jgi:beta-phosphoglucomutase-like phosphatase (HAD superfamily)
MPRFVFWDCDNTLIENAPLHWSKHKETLARHGYTLPEEFRKPLFLNNGQQNWEWLVENLGLTIPLDDYLAEIDAWYHAHIGELPLRDGIPFALNHFKTIGAKQCVVTNARRASVVPMLNVQNILPYFEFTWCKEDYTARKPDPMPYLSAIQKMEQIIGTPIDKADCLAIEDAPEGVEAAHAAGIKVIHRRYKNDDPSSPEAYISVYHENDFIEAIQGL